MKRILTAIAAVALVGCITATSKTYEQGSLSIWQGQVNVSCDDGRAHFSGISIHSDDGPITRFVLHAGIDTNGNGELDPAEITMNIDNPNATSTVTVGHFHMGTAAEGQTALVHYEVYQGGDRPVYSDTISVTR